MKITIIGAGNMGGAIARGLAKGTIFAENEITCTAKSTATLEKLRSTNPQMDLTPDNTRAVAGADIILFAVKPWLMKEVIEQVKTLSCSRQKPDLYLRSSRHPMPAA